MKHFILLSLIAVIAVAQISEEGKKQFLAQRAAVRETAEKISQLRRLVDIENDLLTSQQGILNSMRKGFTAACAAKGSRFVEDPEPHCR